MTIVTYNLAALFERVADTVPDRTALVTPRRRLTFAELDERANRFAHHLATAGIGAGDHVGLHLRNEAEHLEAMLGAFKRRAVPVNVNHRYVADELVHLYTDAGLAAVVYETEFADRVDAARRRVASVRHLVAVGDRDAAIAGSVHYDDAIAAEPGDRDFDDRSGDDLYIAYTGGTTGLPKGVVWRHEDIFFAALGGGDPTGFAEPITEPAEIASRVLPVGAVMLIAPPLSHVSAQWGAFSMLYGGSTVVFVSPGSFDAAEILHAVAAERVNVVTLVGDAMVRPFLDEVEARGADADTSSLIAIASGGAILSVSTKARVRELLPRVMTIDGYGSTETGVGGTRRRGPADDVEHSARFTVGADTLVLDDDLEPVVAGSGAVGRVARRGRLPLRYHNDQERTAALLVERAGERYALTGDAATVDADGTLVLLGRGSVSINTGGEKVYPEEVEAVVKDHAAVRDAVVVGTPDDRWGELVTALVELGADGVLTLDELQAHCRARLAGYKVPRRIVVVPRVERGPNGKADYQWARAQVA